MTTRITSRTCGQTLEIVIDGRLDPTALGHVAQLLLDRPGTALPTLVIDLRPVTALDPQALASLTDLKALLDDHRTVLVLWRPTLAIWEAIRPWAGDHLVSIVDPPPA